MVSEKKTQTKKPAQKKKETTNSKKEAGSKKTTTQKNQKVDLKSLTWDDFKPAMKIIIPVVLLLAVMWYAFTIRAGTATLDGLDQRIEQSIMQNVEQIVAQQVQQQYPDLNQQFLQERVAEEYQKVIDSGTLNYQGQEIVLEDLIDQQTQILKEQFQAENGQTYLTAIDPYLFFNYATDVLENGHPGDQLKEDDSGNLTPFASYRLAPEGKFVGEMGLHEWLQVQLMKFNGVTPESSIGEKTAAIFFIPAIVAMLSAIPCFLILRRFTDDITATMATLLMVSVGTFVSRTVAGFVDTDAYVVFFSLAVVASLVYAFMYENKYLTITLAALAGLFQGLFIWAWGSGWFIFVFLLASLGGYAGYLLIVYLTQLKSKLNIFKEKLINTTITGLTYLISAIVFTFVFTGNNIITSTYNGIFKSFEKVASISSTYIWPNVFSSVAELNPASFSQLLNSFGQNTGSFIFFLALLGIVFLTLDFKSKDKKNDLLRKIIIGFSAFWFAIIVFLQTFVSLTNSSPFLFLVLLFIPVGLALMLSLLNNNISPKVFVAILLSIWVAGTIFMTFNGTRFILLLTPAFAVSFGFALYYIAHAINKFFVEEFQIEKEHFKKLWGSVVAILIFGIVFTPMASSAMQISQNTTPNFDDNWYNAMEEIRTNTSEDAIITSWWDFGHFFAATSERGVTFDGGSQTTPQSHWVGKLLVETNEDVSVDILKMLTCGGNQAFETISNISDDPTNGVWTNDLIYKTLGENRSKTIEILNNYQYHNFTEDDIDQIMQYLDCEQPRENLLITSGDMINKGGVWSHWGQWDFTKKYVHDKYQDESAEEIAQTLDKNQSLIQGYVDELERIDVQAQTQDVNRDQLINEWFAPYSSYAQSFNCQRQNDLIQCQNGLQINSSSGEVNTQNLRRQVSINRVIFPEQDGLREVTNNEDGRFDVLIVPGNRNSVQVQLMHAPLGTALFTKLYYLNGLGTEHFENFYQTQTQTARNVIVWKTLFDKEQPIEDVEPNQVPVQSGGGQQGGGAPTQQQEAPTQQQPTQQQEIN